MRRTFGACLIVMLLAGAAEGSDRAVEAARELFRLVIAEGSVGAMFGQIRALTVAGLTQDVEGRLGERFSGDERERFQAAVDRVLAQHLTLRIFEDECVAVYARHFTADELEQLLAFYRSPVGRKALERGAAMMGEMMLAGQRVGQGIARSQELQRQLFEEIRRALPHRFESADEEHG